MMMTSSSRREHMTDPTTETTTDISLSSIKTTYTKGQVNTKRKRVQAAKI